MKYYRVEILLDGEWETLAVCQMKSEEDVAASAKRAFPQFSESDVRVFETDQAEFEAGRKKQAAKPMYRCPVCFGPAEIGILREKKFVICRSCKRTWETA